MYKYIIQFSEESDTLTINKTYQNTVHSAYLEYCIENSCVPKNIYDWESEELPIPMLVNYSY